MAQQQLRPEILAPAGNAEMLGAAVFSGADAVYLGFAGFNARRTAGNFTPDTLRDAVAFCHGRGVRVHAALNILVYQSELDSLAEAIRSAAEAGVDALIVDDLATSALARQIAPGLPLHGSTQMSIHTPEGACQLAEMGFERAILARELSFEEIREICRKSPIETEIFIHGAMCMAVSGQCMMSAFLGGRSGNRGACAGPCRLPFDAGDLRPGQPGRACHLSLKDMDLIPHMAQIMEAGVASVKIEGRLRTPEYAAAAVTACRLARAGQPYDEALVRDIFSRSGFTDGYFTNRNDGKMFGVRTEEDAARTRAATPRARELFRREFERVPVDFALTVDETGASLTAADREGHSARAESRGEPLSPARNDPAAALEKALRKTGGTPFTAGQCTVTQQGGPWFLPGSAAGELRRQALADLLQARSVPIPYEIHPAEIPDFPARSRAGLPRLAARFERVDQMPDTAAALEQLIFPLAQAENVPEALRSKTLLELPRVMFAPGGEEVVRRKAQAAARMGFAGFVVNNLAQFRYDLGLPLYSGLGLNVTNPLSALRCRQLGVRGLLIHPETPVNAMAGIAGGGQTAALCYGHLPLMLTRACPLKNRPDHASCAHCTRSGRLRDRKGKDFPVRCALPANGVRTIYNPVPLYMGDRLRELPVDLAVAAFTIESKARAAQILAALQAGKPFDADFTRGLYYNDPTKG